MRRAGRSTTIARSSSAPAPSTPRPSITTAVVGACSALAAFDTDLASAPAGGSLDAGTAARIRAAPDPLRAGVTALTTPAPPSATPSPPADNPKDKGKHEGPRKP